IQRELLAHVADAQLDFIGVDGYVNAVHHAPSRREREDPAQHLDDRGLSGTVGSQEPEDLARFDLKAHAVDRGEVAEFSNEIFRENGRHQFTSWNLTSAWIPARSFLDWFSTRSFTPTTWCSRSSLVSTLRGRNSASWRICLTTAWNDSVGKASIFTSADWPMRTLPIWSWGT